MAIITWGFIICLRIYRFFNLIERYYSLKNPLQFLRYLHSCRNQVVLDFSKYLWNYKESSKSQGVFFKFYWALFSVKSQVHSMKPSWLGARLHVIFSQVRAGFCVVINHKLRIVATSLLASFALYKKRNSEAARLKVGTCSPLCTERGWVSKIFAKRWGIQIFPIKREDYFKKRRLLSKRGYHLIHIS